MQEDFGFDFTPKSKLGCGDDYGFIDDKIGSRASSFNTMFD
jgi:hypothetical protein